MKARLYIKQVYTVDHEVVIETDMAEHDLDVFITNEIEHGTCLGLDDVVYTLMDKCKVIETVDGFESGDSEFECYDIEDVEDIEE